MKVSIPQAVSTVATVKIPIAQGLEGPVSIPQAVSTVATEFVIKVSKIKNMSVFQYRKR